MPFRQAGLGSRLDSRCLRSFCKELQTCRRFDLDPERHRERSLPGRGPGSAPSCLRAGFEARFRGPVREEARRTDPHDYGPEWVGEMLVECGRRDRHHRSAEHESGVRFTSFAGEAEPGEGVGLGVWLGPVVARVMESGQQTDPPGARSVAVVRPCAAAPRRLMA